MNKILSKILLYIVEIILGTLFWSLLDYLIGDPINVLHNLIGITFIVSFSNMISYIRK